LGEARGKKKKKVFVHHVVSVWMKTKKKKEEERWKWRSRSSSSFVLQPTFGSPSPKLFF
jgi:hypothetical protein